MNINKLNNIFYWDCLLVNKKYKFAPDLKNDNHDKFDYQIHGFRVEKPFDSCQFRVDEIA